ncbi:peptide chain release factor N(5)-glutamine methyltransferase [Mesorhizobium sp. NBSH29]|uniref:peptide chain release factor N(5)-glutamine methyltransferase n=1 Tax=Mesorhizobium sp. NBSH29 TaxID=2654249 RepID=UPI001896477C|nr:peptide chain release factor N(5)-glutamine methyltransferase [Mesorhizobium sp. NBSH29]QPC85618.1 peptide chain release factor N(5)-glutamine methyltransferase [Mesorhizobium sp. NBSH29]
MAEAHASLGALLGHARRRLSVSFIEDPALEARMIVEHFSSTSRKEAISNPDMPLPPPIVAAVASALDRRLNHEPVHRIFGFREFYGLRLSLSAETLEPRPDTEALVEAVLPIVRKTVLSVGGCRILDLGTGTGAIALALLSEVAQAEATGVDISVDALETAARNAAENGLEFRFTTLCSDWFADVSGGYHVIVSNPPYISQQELAELDPEVRHFDPLRALDGGNDGLDAYRVIARDAGLHLLPGGCVAVEIGHTQKEDVTAIFERADLRLFAASKDLAGSDRTLIFEMK